MACDLPMQVSLLHTGTPVSRDRDGWKGMRQMVNPLARGIAHVSFAGGGTFLPARSPYDRQLLAEHVSERVRTKGQVQVLMGDHLWMVLRNRSAAGTRCPRCGVAVTAACYFRGCGDVGYCITCALQAEGDPARLHSAPERRVG
jgi:hypothetical protein